MNDNTSHDRIIAKLQHFADSLKQTQMEKESLLLTIQQDSCEKEKMKTQIFIYEKISKEYYDMFQDILYG